MDTQNQAKQEEVYLTFSEVEERLKISSTTLWRYVEDPELPLPVMMVSKGIRRVKLSELEKWIEERSKKLTPKKELPRE